MSTSTPSLKAFGKSGRRAPMRLVGKKSTAVCLVLGAVLNCAASFANTAFLEGDASAAGYASSLLEHGWLGVTSAMLNVIAIPLMLLGLLGLLTLASRRTPVLSSAAAIAVTVGMLSFLCMSAALTALYGAGISADGSATEAIASSLTGASGVAMFFVIPFLLGSTTGILFMAAALLRSRVVPVWVSVVLLVFFLMDFIVPSIVWFDAHLLFVLFSIGAAWSVSRTNGKLWYSDTPLN